MLAGLERKAGANSQPRQHSRCRTSVDICSLINVVILAVADELTDKKITFSLSVAGNCLTDKELRNGIGASPASQQMLLLQSPDRIDAARSGN